jgi:hypothetical protein
MVIRLIQNTSIHNKWKTMHNYLKNVPSKKKWHFVVNSYNVLYIVIKNNTIFELYGLLVHSDFVSNPNP